MNSDALILIQTSLYFLALINPAGKVFILSAISPPYSRNELFKVSAKSVQMMLAGVSEWLIQTLNTVKP